MKKKDYVPPEVIVVHLQFESHILAGTGTPPRINFSSDESVGVTSEQNIFGRKQEPVRGERRTYGIEPFARFNF